MTTRKFSVKSRLASFKNALPSALVPALVNLAGLLYFFPFVVVESLGREVQSTLREQYTFFFTNSYVFSSATTLTIIASLLMGIFMFRIFVSKKKINVFYSLGMKRRDLFLSRFFAGALGLVVSTAIPLCLTLFLNISMLGLNTKMLVAGIYLIAGMTITSLACYAITAAVFMLVGTILEGVVFSIVTLGSVGLFASAIQNIAKTTLWGNPYVINDTPYIYSSDLPLPSLAEKMSRFNPLTFFTQIGERYIAVGGNGNVVKGGYYGEGVEVKWENPSFLPLILWGIAVVLLTVLAVYIFKRRKAEIAGFIGKSKIINNFVIAIIGLFFASLIVSADSLSIPYIVKVLISLVVYSVLFLIVQAFFLRDKKRLAKELKILPVHLIAGVVLFTIMGTGMLGYEKHQPKLKNIESATISGSVLDIFANSQSGQSYRYDGGSFLEAETCGISTLGDFTDKEDIEKILSFHEMLIKSEDKADNTSTATNTTVVSYKLKNGTTVTRFYPINDDEFAKALLNIYETKGYKDAIEEFLTGDLPDVTEWLERFDFGRPSQLDRNTALKFEVSQMHVLPADMSHATKVQSLDKAGFDAIKQAMAEDYRVQTTQQRFMPEEEPIGFLLYYSDIGSYIASREDRAIQGEEFSKKTWDDLMKQYSAPRSIGVDFPISASLLELQMSQDSLYRYRDGILIPITKDMKRTIAELEKANLSQYLLKEEKEIKAVYQAANSEGSSSYGDSPHISNRYFVANLVGDKMTTAKGDGSSFSFGIRSSYKEGVDYYAYSDTKEIEEILKVSRRIGYREKEDLVVAVQYTDGTSYKMYIPKSMAPSFMKENKSKEAMNAEYGNYN